MVRAAVLSQDPAENDFLLFTESIKSNEFVFIRLCVYITVVRVGNNKLFGR